MKQRQPNQYSQSNFTGLYWMIGISLLGFVIKTAYDPNILHRPIVGQVEAKQPVELIVEAPKPKIMTIEDKIRLAFPEDPDMAVHVAFCESSLNPSAKHTNSSASGLYQIIRGTWKGYGCGDNPFDPDQNISCARKIYLRNGWGSSASWLASKPCWSK